VTGALVLTSLVFGGNFVALELGLERAGPMTVQAWAVLSATVAVAVIQLLRGGSLGLPRDQLRAAPPIAFFLTVVPSVGIVLGVQRVSAGVSSLVIALSPVATVVLARLLGTSRVTRGQVLGIGLGLAGVAAVTLVGEDATGTRVVGVLWLLAAAVAWAVGLQLTKRNTTGSDPLAFVTWQLGLGAPPMFLLAWLLEGLAADWTVGLVVAVLWSGALSKGVGSVLQYLTTGWASPVQASLTAFLVPVVAFALSVPLLGARLGPEHVVGAVLVAAGVTLVRRGHAAAGPVAGPTVGAAG
jgi:drug/metabolite transporter (DMT)-like permease